MIGNVFYISNRRIDESLYLFRNNKYMEMKIERGWSFGLRHGPIPC